MENSQHSTNCENCKRLEAELDENALAQENSCLRRAIDAHKKTRKGLLEQLDKVKAERDELRQLLEECLAWLIEHGPEGVKDASWHFNLVSAIEAIQIEGGE